LAENPQDLVREGIEAARSGDKLTARRLLQQAISYDPDNEVAWMWMASVVDTVEERRRCLERVLRINPNNARAREALTRLGGTPPARRETTSDTPRVPAGGAVTPNPRVARPVDRTRRQQGLNAYLVAAIVVAVVVIGVVILALISSSGTPLTIGIPAPPTSNLNATFQAAFNIPTLTRTPTPVPTNTVFAVVVTVPPETFEARLPPTFTPTFTPIPTETPVPSPTPYPLSVYPVLYSDYPPARSLSNLYSNMAGGGREVELAVGGFDDIAVDPFGTRIAFARAEQRIAEDGTQRTVQEIYIALIASPESPIQITNFGAVSGHPTWSPDGDALAFVSDTDGDREIYVVDLNADLSPRGAPRQITRNNFADIDPEWAPDGSVIAFASEAEGPGLFEVYTIEPNGANLTRITNASGSNTFPRWSPDMSAMVFVSDRTGSSNIYIMEPNGNSQRLLTFGVGRAQNTTPAWSPDGLWIAFASDRPVSGRLDKFNWYVMDTRGENVAPIAITARTPQSIVFLPSLRLN
jgi:Tol biopolymer transport system component